MDSPFESHSTTQHNPLTLALDVFSTTSLRQPWAVGGQSRCQDSPEQPRHPAASMQTSTRVVQARGTVVHLAAPRPEPPADLPTAKQLSLPAVNMDNQKYSIQNSRAQQRPTSSAQQPPLASGPAVKTRALQQADAAGSLEQYLKELRAKEFGAALPADYGPTEAQFRQLASVHLLRAAFQLESESVLPESLVARVLQTEGRRSGVAKAELAATLLQLSQKLHALEAKQQRIAQLLGDLQGPHATAGTLREHEAIIVEIIQDMNAAA